MFGVNKTGVLVVAEVFDSMDLTFIGGKYIFGILVPYFDSGSTSVGGSSGINYYFFLSHCISCEYELEIEYMRSGFLLIVAILSTLFLIVYYRAGGDKDCYLLSYTPAWVGLPIPRLGEQVLSESF